MITQNFFIKSVLGTKCIPFKAVTITHTHTHTHTIQEELMKTCVLVTLLIASCFQSHPLKKSPFQLCENGPGPFKYFFIACWHWSCITLECCRNSRRNRACFSVLSYLLGRLLQCRAVAFFPTRLLQPFIVWKPELLQWTAASSTRRSAAPHPPFTFPGRFCRWAFLPPGLLTASPGQTLQVVLSASPPSALILGIAADSGTS